MTGLCQICGHVYCDHTREERGLTEEEWKIEMEREITPEELEAVQSGDTKRAIRVARIVAARIYGKTYSLPDGDIVGL